MVGFDESAAFVCVVIRDYRQGVDGTPSADWE